MHKLHDAYHLVLIALMQNALEIRSYIGIEYRILYF